MSDYIFLFDLDSTMTKKEILPEISVLIGREKEIRAVTESTMKGEIPFEESFLKRVKILSQISVKTVNKLVSEIPLNEEIVRFMMENHDRCYVVTGNLDIWISGLMNKLGMMDHCLCSTARDDNDTVGEVLTIRNKYATARSFKEPLVVVGDGDNDSEMAAQAAIAIGYGGVRPIAPSLLNVIDYAFYDEDKCAEFLRGLL
ncbi:MAG: HAD-IB family phosphatase [Erysipelotrichaceae bacterium]|nr:HAD-IB family phosphatase [Erysipelotrichaceae bacterium]